MKTTYSCLNNDHRRWVWVCRECKRDDLRAASDKREKLEREVDRLRRDRDGWRETARQSQGPVEFLKGEYDKLLKIIEDFPHDSQCEAFKNSTRYAKTICNCWTGYLQSKVTE